MNNLVEYSWDEVTSNATLVYENEPNQFSVETKHQPLIVTPNPDRYWGELIWFLKTQGVDQ